MLRPRLMQRFARWHIWLGWIVAVPILMWAITGLVMVARPIEQVRGDHLRAPAATIDPAAVTFPARIDEPIREARLVAHPDGPRWIVTAANGARWRYSATQGTAIPPVVAEEAVRIAEAAYAGEAPYQATAYSAAGEAPVEARTGGAVWGITFADGTTVYIDDATGEVLSLRTDQWRLYDLMWGLHIMDPQTREDTQNVFVIMFALATLAGATLGTILLFRRRKARVRA